MGFVININEKYLEALKAIDDWVTISTWADRVAQDYPALLEQADEDDIEPEVAVYAALAAAVVLARSVDMDDAAIRERFDKILKEEFPESMLKEGRG